MTYLYTAAQTLKVLESWGVKDPLPKKGSKLLISLPAQVLNLATIAVHDEKSTYDKKLYRIELVNSQNIA